jgi:hypothetical protein
MEPISGEFTIPGGRTASPDQSGIVSPEAQTIVAPDDDVAFHSSRVARRGLFLEGMAVAGIKGQPRFGRARGKSKHKPLLRGCFV